VFSLCSTRRMLQKLDIRYLWKMYRDGSFIVMHFEPIDKFSNSLFNGGVGPIAVVPFKGTGIGPGPFDIPRLYRGHFLYGLFIENLFNGFNKIKQSDRFAIADVVKVIEFPWIVK